MCRCTTVGLCADGWRVLGRDSVRDTPVGRVWLLLQLKNGHPLKKRPKRGQSPITSPACRSSCFCVGVQGSIPLSRGCLLIQEMRARSARGQDVICFGQSDSCADICDVCGLCIPPLFRAPHHSHLRRHHRPCFPRHRLEWESVTRSTLSSALSWEPHCTRATLTACLRAAPTRRASACRSSRTRILGATKSRRYWSYTNSTSALACRWMTPASLRGS